MFTFRKRDNIQLFPGGKISCQGCEPRINSSPLLDITLEAKKGPLSATLLMLTDLLTVAGGLLHSLLISDLTGLYVR